MPQPDDTIKITEKDFEELKRLYNNAKPNEVFTFKGKELLKEYAGYVIEHIQNQIGGQQ
jgi:hypothetical protein